MLKTVLKVSKYLTFISSVGIPFLLHWFLSLPRPNLVLKGSLSYQYTLNCLLFH